MWIHTLNIKLQKQLCLACRSLPSPPIGHNEKLHTAYVMYRGPIRNSASEFACSLTNGEGHVAIASVEVGG